MMLALATHAEPATPAELWAAHADELLRFATVLVGPDDANDIVVDTFVTAAEKALRPDVANARAYLYRSVANRAASMRRSEARRWRRDLAAVGPASTDGPDEFSDVRRAVADLTPPQRAAVFCAYWLDMPEREIAGFLGRSPGSVHRALVRAKTTLRKALT